jgi:hypothetical protein
MRPCNPSPTIKIPRATTSGVDRVTLSKVTSLIVVRSFNRNRMVLAGGPINVSNCIFESLFDCRLSIVMLRNRYIGDHCSPTRKRLEPKGAFRVRDAAVFHRHVGNTPR